LLLADVGGLGVIIGLKRLFQRPRPEEVFSHLGYSFPSGHSFFAVVVYGLLAHLLARDANPRQRRLIWISTTAAIFLVGFSRIFVGEHFPSDVAAGFAVAIPWLWGCLAIPQAFHRRGRRDVTPDEVRNRYRNGKARLLEAQRALPALITLTRGLAEDTRVPGPRRWALRFTAGYVAFPLNLFPNVIPALVSSTTFFF
jgi:membrane-associated phospholipid phosphatase